ncbi:MAG: DUF2281 domain-containing protein [Brasilonema sp.]
MSIVQIATQKLQALPLDKQQEVLDFIEFLQSKLSRQDSNQESKNKEPISFLEAAQKFAGCVDFGPGDLATNKQYLEELGSE